MVIECLCKVKLKQCQKGPCHAAARAGDAEEKGKRAVIEQENNKKDGSKLCNVFYQFLFVQRSTSKEEGAVLRQPLFCVVMYAGVIYWWPCVL